jgi:phospholipid/cholesterol/gamma-HCH transport system substrate-binding protein
MAELPQKREDIRRQVLLALGLAVVLALVLAGGIASKHGLFSRHAEVYFISDSAAGISPGLSVRLSGFRVGSVTAVDLQNDLKVRVTMKIEEARFAALRADAHAEWFKEQLQAAVIDLSPGQAAEPLSRTDPRVTHARRRTLTEVANDLRGRLAPILDDVKQLSGTLVARKDDLGAVLQNARTTTEQLAATTAELRALAANAKGSVATVGDRARQVMGQASQAMGQVQGSMTQVGQTLVRLDGLVEQARGTLDSVNGRLPGLLGSANDTLDQINAIGRDLRAVSAAASSALPGVVRGTGPLLDDARDMVGGVRSAWPMRGLVAPPPPALVPLDSHDAARVRDANGR